MCNVCNRADRATIEGALVSMTTGVTRVTIEELAERFSVDVEELKTHALFHTPLVSAEDIEASQDERHDSLVRAMKLKEADMLAVVNAEYLVTLKAMGRRINRLLETGEATTEEDRQFKTSKLLTKPMVEMYLGLGSEIRQTVKTAAEIDRMLNGPQDNATAGLAALAEAIRGSSGGQE